MKKICSRFIAMLMAALCCLGAMGAARPQCTPVGEIVLRPLAGTPAPGEEPQLQISEKDAEYIAKTLYGEYRGPDKLQQAAVAWCILNRTDYYGESVEAIVTAPNQFMGYSKYNPVLPELYAMAEDVLRRHALEKLGAENVGRILPSDYMWFWGDGRVNHYRNKFVSGSRWDWSLPDPYLV